MKIIGIALLVSSSASASICDSRLLHSLNNDPNIEIVKFIDYYDCSETACAHVYEHNSFPYPNLRVLAFLDTKTNMKVNWVPVNSERIYGHEPFSGKKITYVTTSMIGHPVIEVDASIETDRGSVFWPPHRVYYKESFKCFKR